MKLLDSNIIIYSAKPEFSYLRPLLEDDNNFYSAISEVEILGYQKLKPIDERYFKSVFFVLNSIAITDDILQKAIDIRRVHNTPTVDSIIAASALIYDLELYTRNSSDFQRITDLKLVNPIQ